MPGTGQLPSATDCAGGFHSLAAAPAIVQLAGTQGLVADIDAHEPYAATLVRVAVAAPDVPAHARFLDILADRVSIGAASVVAVLDPGCVVLGGEVGRAGGAVLAARVEERLARMSPFRRRCARARWAVEGCCAVRC